MSSTEIEVRSGGALAVGAEQTEWTEQQLAVLRSAGVDKDVLPAELTAFLHESQRTGLDPFSKQIYLIGRWDGREQRKVFRSQTGIDGYRVVAHRAARRDRVELEYDDTQWCAADGTWRDVWLEQYPPAAAKVVLRKNGKAFPAVATLNEYAALDRNNNPTPMWRKMPATMLAKCAEALALRKAFPHDLSGIYTAEEMEQADARAQQPPQAQRSKGNPPAEDPWATPAQADVPAAAPDDGIADAEIVGEQQAPQESTHAQRTKLVILAKEKRGVTADAARHALASVLLGREITSFKELTLAEAHQLIETLQGEPDVDAEPGGPPDGWTAEQSDQLAADFLAALQGARTDQERAQIAKQIGAAVKAAKLTAADRETLLAAYTGRQPQPVGATA